LDFATLRKSRRHDERVLQAIFLTTAALLLAYFAVWDHLHLGPISLVSGLLTIGLLAMAVVRRVSVRTRCASCDYDLSNVILTKAQSALYCPQCGIKHA